MDVAEVGLGTVTAPSGVLVLGMGGWTDYWPRVGDPLSERARGAAAHGGGHLHGPAGVEPAAWMCEAVAVSAAADRALPVRARTAPSPFDGGPTVAVLDVELGVPWAGPSGTGSVRLGELPVDRTGMVVGDATALDGFTVDGESFDGLADVTYWGKYADEVHGLFGGRRVVPDAGGRGPRGWLDLPVAEAERIAARLEEWVEQGPGSGLMVSVDFHTHHHLAQRAGWGHPLLAGAVEVGGCRVLGLGWDPGDHSMRHRGERRFGQVYPVTLERHRDGTLLRWTIPPYEAE
jgi:hypothetical protein